MHLSRANRPPHWAVSTLKDVKVSAETKKDEATKPKPVEAVKPAAAPAATSKAVVASKGASKVKAVGATFTINNVQHTVSADNIGPSMSMAKYIREVACLPGTKVSCNEGGCGACIVTVKKFAEDKPRSLNSCLTPILACDGWSITTVEGLGGKTVGYHPIQSKLAAEGGTQCGYCSPGMVMQMHAWMEEHPNATQIEIDNILDGNICRCTGYRPILQAFKSFASDNPDGKMLADIEDLKLCHATGKACPGSGSCGSPLAASCHSSGRTEIGSYEWHDPTTVQELLGIMGALDDNTKYRLVSGDTAKGVYKNDGPFDVYINLNKIQELQTASLDNGVVLGANVKITDAINLLETADDEVYVGVANHMKKIASWGIRNQGSLAGNLMIKNAHNEFPSDVFLSLETAGAIANITSADGAVTSFPIGELPYTNMNKKILTTITIPINEQVASKKKTLNNLWLQSSNKTPSATAGQVWKYKSYKVMPRSSNAHAYVNAGFKALIDTEDNFKIIGKPRLVFGGINETFVHATATEAFLMDRNMNDHDMFLEAMATLAGELVPDDDPVLATPLYRKQLAMGLFYKFYLYVLGDSASTEVQSGWQDLDRGLSKGVQDWETDESQWPISQYVEKTEAKIQCAGEAEFVNDIPSTVGELQAAFVLTSRANCDIAGIDVDAALAVKGVVSYVDAKDIPGMNDWMMDKVPEPIFSTTRSEYAGQPVGVIVAETRELATEAAKLVKITYANQGVVITDMEESMKNAKNVVQGAPTIEYGDQSAMDSADTVVSGRFKMGSQYHFHMETHVCIARPTDDGFDIEVPSQFIIWTSLLLSKVMNLQLNNFNVKVKRLGGAYGAKIYLQNCGAAAATVAAGKLGRPVRLWMNLEDNMRMLGKRNPYMMDYEMGFDANRKIKAVKADIYCDAGWNLNKEDSIMACLFGQSCYHIPSLSFTPYGVSTMTQTHTSARAPGMVNGHAMLEHMLEHAASQMEVDPMELRMNNLMMEGSPVLPPPATLPVPCPIEDMVGQLKAKADYDNRVAAANTFNQANKWKKRGISMVPMRFPHAPKGYGIVYSCMLSVFGMDGTISVTVGGIEMGQGLNTKVHQVVAKELGVDMSLIKIKAATLVAGPNDIVTGGSFGSELNCAAAVKACAVLNANLQPIKDQLGPDATWEQIIGTAAVSGVDLCVRGTEFADKDDKVQNYSVWGAVISEVEVDILTGEQYVVRTDLIEDAGLSTSPQVDIGQVEGAFMMGLGLWTSEQIKFDPTTGELLTKNTWEYKPPAAKDIPQEFNVTLLKNSRNPVGVFSSKATGEPALLLAVSVLFAIKNALTACRADAGLAGWWKLDGPATVEKIHQHSGITPDMFTF